LIRIAAVGDIHSKKYLQEFRTCLSNTERSDIDLFLLAGDLVYKGQYENIQDVLNVLEENHIECPIISCFGNEEYTQIREQIRQVAGNRIRFLEDEDVIVSIDNLKVGIVGSQGSLEKPTPWQADNIDNIDSIYSERINRIQQLLVQLSSDVKILLTHYPPTYKVLKGEIGFYYPHIGCQRCERIISRSTVNAVICAHSHRGIPYAVVNDVPVYNVSLPAVHKITLIDV
jgi:Icc-related predicted phosphoesterase